MTYHVLVPCFCRNHPNGLFLIPSFLTGLVTVDFLALHQGNILGPAVVLLKRDLTSMEGEDGSSEETDEDLKGRRLKTVRRKQTSG